VVTPEKQGVALHGGLAQQMPDRWGDTPRLGFDAQVLPVLSESFANSADRVFKPKANRQASCVGCKTEDEETGVLLNLRYDVFE